MRSGLGFAFEASKCLRVLGKGIGKKLQRDETFEAIILRFIDNAPFSLRRASRRCVVRDRLTDERVCAQHGAHVRERRLYSASKLFIIIYIYGGGGGSRTPVRKALRAEDYMLSSVQFFSPAALRMSKKRSRLVRWFSPEPYGPKGSSQPAK